MQPERKGKTSSLKEQCLRYFTPREVGNPAFIFLVSSVSFWFCYLFFYFSSFYFYFLFSLDIIIWSSILFTFAFQVANLHSFPDDFNFPEHVSLRQRYVTFSKLVFCLSPCEKAGRKCLKVRLQIRMFESSSSLSFPNLDSVLIFCLVLVACFHQVFWMLFVLTSGSTGYFLVLISCCWTFVWTKL